MPIVGFGFDKINGERKEFIKKVKIENKINVTSLKESKLMIGKEEKAALKAVFEFNVDYESAGKLQMIGHVVYFDTDEVIKDLLEKWKKDEKIPVDFGTLVYNFIISKCSIKALQLEEDLGLPLHISFPRIVQKKKE